jgi:hypothetical protein
MAMVWELEVGPAEGFAVLGSPRKDHENKDNLKIELINVIAEMILHSCIMKKKNRNEKETWYIWVIHWGLHYQMKVKC